MVGDTLFVTGGHHTILFLEAQHDAVDGFFQILHLDLIAIAAYGQQRRFVHDIREIGANHARSARGYDLQVGFGRQLDLGHMDLEYGLTAFEVGTIHDDLTIETACSH
jgi:hypothetical protein